MNITKSNRTHLSVKWLQSLGYHIYEINSLVLVGICDTESLTSVVFGRGVYIKTIDGGVYSMTNSEYENWCRDIDTNDREPMKEFDGQPL